MFCNVMFWIVASELIKFEIKYPYMYHFVRSYNAQIWSLSNVISLLSFFYLFISFISFALPKIRSKQKFCYIMFWIVASELINFEIKYPYMFLFGG